MSINIAQPKKQAVLHLIRFECKCSQNANESVMRLNANSLQQTATSIFDGHQGSMRAYAVPHSSYFTIITACSLENSFFFNPDYCYTF